MRKKFIINALLLFLVLYFTNCKNNEQNQWKLKDGYIVDSESAIKLAEIVWLNVYGSKIKYNKPFKAILKDGKIWVVEGTLSDNTLGGVPYIEIQKSDGKILKVTHGK
jgi:hypothetical protein